MNKFILLIIILFLATSTFAQKERKFVREGNNFYDIGLKDTAKLDTISFGNAEIAYRKALAIKPDDFFWQFNLADAIYKQTRAADAQKKFESLVEKTQKPTEKAMLYHNLGNSLLMQNKLDSSIIAYKKALRINPTDLDTKYNLAYAMKKKQEDQKQKDQNKDQNKDKDKEQDKDKEKNKEQNKENQQEQNQQQNNISQQNAEQILQALENDEKKTQEKVKKEQVRVDKRQVDKNW